MTESDTSDRDDASGVQVWKRDFLELATLIDAFQTRRMVHVAGLDEPPALGHAQPANVAWLLNHYLSRCRELLLAEVQGGLEEVYQEEVNVRLSSISLLSDTDPSDSMETDTDYLLNLEISIERWKAVAEERFHEITRLHTLLLASLK